jgi:hypothetical protein
MSRPAGTMYYVLLAPSMRYRKTGVNSRITSVVRRHREPAPGLKEFPGFGGYLDTQFLGRFELLWARAAYFAVKK